jgi:tRNA(adenine34) deaminase
MCDAVFMQKAYEQALEAYFSDETPIGCVIEYGGKIIGSGYNLRNTKKNPLCHAEIAAINEAAGYMGDWRLEGATIYVTVEPCPMCAGAIVQARIKRLVYGTENKKAGFAGSVINLFDLPGLNHKVEVTGGVMREQTSKLMSAFFEALRGRNV